MSDFLIKLFVTKGKDDNSPALRKKYGVFSSIVGVILNVVLAVFKLIVGLISSSIAIIFIYNVFRCNYKRMC